MDTLHSDELGALIAEIWGREALDEPPELDPEVRDLQNQALSVAIRIYLQSYLDDLR